MTPQSLSISHFKRIHKDTYCLRVDEHDQCEGSIFSGYLPVVDPTISPKQPFLQRERLGRAMLSRLTMKLKSSHGQF